MGVYDDEIAADAAEVLDEVGRSVTYSPGGSNPVAITVKLGPEDVEELAEQDGRARVRRRTAHALPSVVTDPSTADTFTIDAVVYAVRTVTETGLFIQFELEAREQRRIGGGNSFIAR